MNDFEEGLITAKINLSENALTVLKKRYLKKDEEGKVIETPEDLFRRVANNIAQADKLYGADEIGLKETEEEFYELLTSLKFLPNSPCLRGAGRELQQLSACFVLPIEDDMEAIFSTLKNAAMVHKTGGGTGFDFSRLRPKGDIIHSTGNATPGPMSFLRLYNAMAEEVTQGGVRMGANMGMLRADHPDIEDFISSKADLKSITNFNISISATDNFMKAVIEDAEYELINPRTKKPVKKVKARQVFDRACYYAWQNGDPGMIFIDKINNSSSNPTPKLGMIEATNPCVTGETLVSTEKGLVKIKDIAQDYNQGGLKICTDNRTLALSGSFGFQNPVYSLVKTKPGVTFQKISAAFRTGVKEVWKLTTQSGLELIATPDHKIMTTTGWKELKDLIPGLDKILIQPAKGRLNQEINLPFAASNLKLNLPQKWSKELGQVIGWLVGDGWLRDKDKNCRVGFTFSQEDKKIMDHLKSILNNFYGKEIKEILRENKVYHLSYHSKFFVDFFKKLGVKSWKSINKEVPESIFTAPEETVIGFLQGLFTADGTIGYIKDVNSYIRLTSKSLNLLKSVQLLLLNLGIRARIYNRSRKEREGFEYISKSGEKRIYKLDGICFELSISKDAVPLFLEKIGFLENKHSLKIEKLLSKNYYHFPFVEDIKRIEFYGKEEVYDLTEPVSHSFIANGLVISNCGEQPLLSYESCVLGSINLAKHLKDGENGRKEIDFNLLKDSTQKAIHFLDNVIDMNRYAVPEIEKMTKGLRRIGLGVMGFADMLVDLEIPYGSEESNVATEKVMKFINDTARDASRELAKSRGSYPFFKDSLDYEKGEPPIRNVARTTIAPTGTIAVIADCSSGIEPVFALVHRRRSIWKGQKAEVEMLVVDKKFEKVAREKGFYSQELMEKVAQKGSVQDLEEVPEEIKRIFVTAFNLTPKDHVLIQAAFQRHVDNAVSKTINFPHQATVEDVKEAYLLAYKTGCKGITVYRDGSRNYQVLEVGKKEKEKTTEENEKAIPVSHYLYPRERPEQVAGTTYKTRTSYGSLYVTINDDEEGKPFEIFAAMGKAGGFFAAKVEAISRMISLALRSGIPPSEVIDQLKGIRGPSPIWNEGELILSVPDAIAKILEKHLGRHQTKLALDFKKEETENINPLPQVNSITKPDVSLADLGEAPGCPECGGPLTFQEGCLKCNSCGYSKCG